MLNFKSDNLHVTENAMQHMTNKLDLENNNKVVAQSNFYFKNGSYCTISRFFTGHGKTLYNLYFDGYGRKLNVNHMEVVNELLELSWKNEIN